MTRTKKKPAVFTDSNLSPYEAQLYLLRTDASAAFADAGDFVDISGGNAGKLCADFNSAITKHSTRLINNIMFRGHE